VEEVRLALGTRLADIETQLGSLSKRLNGQGVATVGSPEGGEWTHERIAGKLKEVLASVLIENGILASLVEKSVERRLKAPGASASEGVAAGGLGASETQELVRDEIQESLARFTKEFLNSEALKVLIDEKFRTMTVYLKTEVIPKAVRQAVKETAPETASAS
jgi:hypothetical protein